MNNIKTAPIAGLARRLIILVSIAVLSFSITAETAKPEIGQVIKDFRLKTSPARVDTYSNWSKPDRIVVRVDSDERLQWLQSAVPQVNLIGAGSYADAVSAIPGADGVM